MEDLDSVFDDIVSLPELGLDNLSWLQASPQPRGTTSFEDAGGASCCSDQPNESYTRSSKSESILDGSSKTGHPNTSGISSSSSSSSSDSSSSFYNGCNSSNSNNIVLNGCFGNVFSTSEIDSQQLPVSVLASELPRRNRNKSCAKASVTPLQSLSKPNSSTASYLNKRNAEACRRNRLKRRAEEEFLRNRNEELQQNRALYMQRIADLQNQVDVLCMGADTIDLRKENEFLKAEIVQQKAYLDGMVKAIRRHPSILPEERARLLRSCLENSVAYVVGLAHLSTSWRHIYSAQFEKFSMNSHYDTLPRNVSLGEVRRINIRSEFVNVPVSASKFHEIMISMWNDRNRASRLSAALKRTSHWDWRVDPLSSPELDESISNMPPDEKVCISRCLEIQEGTYEHKTTMSAYSTKKDLIPRAIFRQDGDGDKADGCTATSHLADQHVSAYIHAMTNCDAELEQAQIPTGIKGHFKFTSGHVAIPDQNDPNTCHVVAIVSIPVGEFQTVRSPYDMITEEGTLTESYARLYHAQVEYFLEEVSGLCEATAVEF